MATQSNPTHRGVPLMIVVPKEMWGTLRKAAQLSMLTEAQVASEMVQTGLADERLRKLPPDFLIAGKQGDAPRTGKRVDVHRDARALSPEQVQRLLFLWAEGYGPARLSERFNIAVATVARILKRHERSEHVKFASKNGGNPPDLQFGMPRKKDGDE
jgi:hypothetical protein